MKSEFSIVLPVANRDKHLLPKTLPSWLALGSDDVILCLDKPAPIEIKKTIMRIVDKHQASERVTLLELERDPEWEFHQAYVRRRGFLQAKHDKILTGDTDLRVYPACLKAVELVGRDDVGLVSLQKLRTGFTSYLRTFLLTIRRAYLKASGSPKASKYYFTGLYCIWRPFWIDSEKEEDAKKLKHPFFAPLITGPWGGYVGEDTLVRDSMEKKHRVLYLPQIGAHDLQTGLEERKEIQLKIGASFAYKMRSPPFVLGHSVIHLRPHVLGSYIRHVAQACGGIETAGTQVLRSLLVSVAYGVFQAVLRVLYGRKKIHVSTEDMSRGISRVSLSLLLNMRRHEFPVSVALKKLTGDLFVDVGANVGYYSLLLGNNFNRVVAFEPGHSFYLLKRNIRLLNAKNIIPVNFAVTNYDGTAVSHLARYGPYHQFVTTEQLTLCPDVIRGAGAIVGFTTVGCVSLASFFKLEPRIDLVKVDVEGGEWLVLEGAGPILEKIDRWLVELHSLERRGELQAWFASRGYRTKWLSFGEATAHLYCSKV